MARIDSFTQLNLEVYKPVLTERRHQEEIIARSAKLRAQQLTSGRWPLSVNLAKYGIERADDLLTPALRKSIGFDALDGEATDAVLLKANVAARDAAIRQMVELSTPLGLRRSNPCQSGKISRRWRGIAMKKKKPATKGNSSGPSYPD